MGKLSNIVDNERDQIFNRLESDLSIFRDLGVTYVRDKTSIIVSTFLHNKTARITITASLQITLEYDYRNNRIPLTLYPSLKDTVRNIIYYLLGEIMTKPCEIRKSIATINQIKSSTSSIEVITSNENYRQGVSLYVIGSFNLTSNITKTSQKQITVRYNNGKSQHLYLQFSEDLARLRLNIYKLFGEINNIVSIDLSQINDFIILQNNLFESKSIDLKFKLSGLDLILTQSSSNKVLRRKKNIHLFSDISKSVARDFHIQCFLVQELVKKYKMSFKSSGVTSIKAYYIDCYTFRLHSQKSRFFDDVEIFYRAVNINNSGNDCIIQRFRQPISIGFSNLTKQLNIFVKDVLYYQVRLILAESKNDDN